MRLPRLGHHLHHQIVIPLVVALVVVGIIATLVAVSLIGQLISDWINQNARSTSAAVIAEIDEHGTRLVKEARLVSGIPSLAAAAQDGDVPALGRQLVMLNRSLDEDNLMMLDAQGRVVASTGRLLLEPGADPIDPRDRAFLAGRTSRPVFARIGDRQTLCGIQPMKGPGGEAYTLVLSIIVDDHYLGSLSLTSEAALALYDASGRYVAFSVPREIGDPALAVALRESESEIDQAITRTSGGVSDAQVLIAGEAEYHTVAEKVTFADADPAGNHLYLATIVGTGVTDTARLTTTNLIVMWSTVAIAGLIGLGYYVARGISRPLALLSESAAQVAEGDFASHVAIPGRNELSDLAHNFNRMTDSLRERSESLTKKVLELATLYEMSRSLGSTLDLDALLDSVIDSALRIFDVEIGYITLVDHDTGRLEVRAWKGADLSRSGEIAVRNSMSEWVIREGRPLIFNPQTDQNGAPRGDGMAGALAALCVPLTSAEGTIGSITVGSRNPDQRFTSDDVRLLATIANHVTIAVGNIGLFSSVQEAYLATVRALAAAVDAKDPYTRGHSNGVAAYALRIGEAMVFSQEQMVALEMAAYLHDIGKIGISEDILLKPGKLTDAEMSQMRHHPLIGANILKPVAFPWPIAPIVRHHHEHYDGDGYPAGLKTEEIPILARVLTVADAFEAMVADRPYRRGRSQQEAILELRRCSGTQFDPRVVEAFVNVLESEGAGAAEATPADEEVGPDEAQAVYIAIADAMFASFRRLGGPRLANNLERSLNERLREEGMPLIVQAGRLLPADGELSDDEMSDHLGHALTLMGVSIEEASGTGLADHFLSEALETLPERMRMHAERLGLLASA